MVINHNLSAMNAQRQMGVNQTNATKSMEKLSSGLRINRAGDDAAGLAISEKMRGQIRGLDQASRNAQDGISLIQTAEGALNETHSILQRMKELATQAANGTNTESDRTEIQEEINQLTSEVNRIGNTTEFNTQKLLSGSGETITAGKLATSTTGINHVDGSITITSADLISSGVTIEIGGTTYSYDAGDESGDKYKTVDDLIEDINAKGGYTASKDTSTGNLIITSTTGNVTGVTLSGAAVTASTNYVAGAKAAYTTDIDVSSLEVGQELNVGGVTLTLTTDNINDIGTSSITVGDYKLTKDGEKLKLEKTTVGEDTAPVVSVKTPDVKENGKFKFQIGANTGQSMEVVIEDMRASALGITSDTGSTTKTVTVDGKSYTAEYVATAGVTNGTDSVDSEYALDVSSHEKATAAIKVYDDAINKVSSERSKLGAVQNRLEHTINNLGTSSENLTAAESRVRDVDMAKEMMEMSKNNILQQASQAMLAQANQAPQQVLQLLR